MAAMQVKMLVMTSTLFLKVFVEVSKGSMMKHSNNLRFSGQWVIGAAVPMSRHPCRDSRVPKDQSGHPHECGHELFLCERSHSACESLSNPLHTSASRFPGPNESRSLETSSLRCGCDHFSTCHCEFLDISPATLRGHVECSRMQYVTIIQFSSTTSLLQSRRFRVHWSATLASCVLVVPKSPSLSHRQNTTHEFLFTSHERERNPSRTWLRYHEMFLYVCALVSEWLLKLTCL